MQMYLNMLCERKSNGKIHLTNISGYTMEFVEIKVISHNIIKIISLFRYIFYWYPCSATALSELL